MCNKQFKIYCLVIALILFFPFVGTLASYGVGQLRPDFLWKEQELNGVVAIPPKPELSLENIVDGTFQTSVEDYLEYNLFGRRTWTRVYNQLLYTLFHSTDNREMLVGRNDYLFEKAYATAYLDELSEEEAAALKYNIDRMTRLNELLKKRGIPLVIRISPSKAEIYPEYLPAAYDRFIKMKQNGMYRANWYQTFSELAGKTDIPVYDRHTMLVQMKSEGEIVFAKGGTHWSLAPMAEYINGLNALLEQLLNRELGRMVVTDKKAVVGEMGNIDDSDIWKICWNALSVKPNYPSPHITYTSVSAEEPLRVFTIGQSFSTLLLSTIYSVDEPVWDETLFSWYNGRVLQYTAQTRGGLQVSETTENYADYLEADVIIIEFLENGPGWVQFEFVNNMIQHLEKDEENL